MRAATNEDFLLHMGEFIKSFAPSSKLADALDLLVSCDAPGIASLVPGRLAYVSGEGGERYICARE